jgi:hypothetical protein
VEYCELVTKLLESREHELHDRNRHWEIIETEAGALRRQVAMTATVQTSGLISPSEPAISPASEPEHSDYKIQHDSG